MKLNLLPTYVGKEKAARSAIFLSIIFAAIGIGAAVLLITSSKDAVARAKTRMDDAAPRAAQAVAVSKSADDVIKNASMLILNTNLAAEMDKHNAVYPDLYDKVRKYVPSFFRVTSMSAAPTGEDTTVTLQGVIETQQQYADLMMALMRIPGAKGVTRQNYTIIEKVVPPLSENSQKSEPVLRGTAPLPDDPIDRLNYYISQPKTEGFLNEGNFGSTDPTVTKGAMPNWSLITVTVVFPGNIQTPNPSATLDTLATGSAGATPAAMTGGGPGGGGAPARPGGGGRGADTGDMDR